jgi:hypothetical protein
MTELSPLLPFVGTTRQGLELSELRSRAIKDAHRKESERFKATVQSARLSQVHPPRLKKASLELDQNQVPGTSSIRRDSSPVKVSAICVVITEWS